MTSLEFPDTPDPVDDLYDALLRKGFRIIENVRGGMGGLSVILRSEAVPGVTVLPAEVQISADRGHWAIGIRFEGMTRFLGARPWTAVLDGAPFEARDLAKDALFVSDRLFDASIAAAKDPDLEPKLVKLSHDYMLEQRAKSGTQT